MYKRFVREVRRDRNRSSDVNEYMYDSMGQKGDAASELSIEAFCILLCNEIST